MRKTVNCIPARKTQTALSAFFCFHKCITTRLTAALVVTLLVGAPSLSAYQKKPVIQLKGVSVERIDWTKRVAQTSLSILIDNPGPAFRVKDLNYRLELNDRKAAEGSYDKEIEIPAESSAAFNLPCDVDLNAVPGVAWGIIAGGFDVHYELETEFTVPLPMLNPRIKSSLGGDLSLASTVSGWSARIKERVTNK